MPGPSLTSVKKSTELNGMVITPELREMYKDREQLLPMCVPLRPASGGAASVSAPSTVRMAGCPRRPGPRSPPENPDMHLGVRLGRVPAHRTPAPLH